MEVLPGPEIFTGVLVMGKSGIHKALMKQVKVRLSYVLAEIETTKRGRERVSL